MRPILDFSKIKNYLHRVTSLYLIQHVYDLLSPELKKRCWGVISELAKDSVPNIRMAVCETLAAVAPGESAARKILAVLGSDPDADVVEAARRIG